MLTLTLDPFHWTGRFKLKAIAASASNTWGLFWLVLLLGYGLVDVPRSVWRNAQPGSLLTRMYFKAAKLNAEKSEAEENLEDYLDSLQSVLDSVQPADALRKHAETIMDKVPLEWRERLKRRTVASHAPIAAADINEKSLVRLHWQVLDIILNQIDDSFSMKLDEQRTECYKCWGVYFFMVCW